MQSTYAAEMEITTDDFAVTRTEEISVDKPTEELLQDWNDDLKQKAHEVEEHQHGVANLVRESRDPSKDPLGDPSLLVIGGSLKVLPNPSLLVIWGIPGIPEIPRCW